MIARIADNTRFSTMAGNIANLQDSMSGVSEQLSTQKKINQPSDDPEGAKLVLNLRAAGAAIDQYQGNIISGQTWLKTTALTLNGIADLLTLAQGVAQNAAGGSVADRTAAAASLQTITDQILAYANGELDGRYLFAGVKTDTKPFPDTTSAYQGDSNALQINIGQSTSAGYNITGAAVFPASAGGGVALFETLDALKAALLANDSPAMTTALTDLQNAGRLVQDNITTASAMVSNLEFADGHLTYLKNNVGSMISSREDADVTQLAMKLQMQALALNATYSTVAKIGQNTNMLLEFLTGISL